MRTTPLIKSEILNDVTILELGKNNTIGDSHFSGINYFGYKNIFESPSLDTLSQFENKTFDYIVTHQYTLEELFIKKNDWVKSLNRYNIKSKEFIIDLLGEGHNLHTFLRDFYGELKKLNCEKIKILAPFSEYKGLEEKYSNIEFFKYRFGGPRIFCSKHNRGMIHGHYTLSESKVININHNTLGNPRYDEVVLGTKWLDIKKNKLFMCLNNEPREHRVFMVNKIIEKDILDLGFVSFRSSNSIFSIWISGDADEDLEIVKVPQLLLEEKHFETNRFGLLPNLTNDAYINVITESSHNIMPFITEKTTLPFYSLQFPIIFGYQGIVNDLREEGFDMFDDIINHSYDEVEYKWENNRKNNEENIAAKIKADMISDELLRLSKLDIHSIYQKNKKRFLNNQELLYKKTIEENNIFKDLGKFIFGNNVVVNELDIELNKLVIE